MQPGGTVARQLLRVFSFGSESENPLIETDHQVNPFIPPFVAFHDQVGLAAALECAKAGQKVLVLERFTLFNASGSSGDFVRMFRVMYTENYMADLALAGRNKWKELETSSGESLIKWSGEGALSSSSL
jgi:sarcosine oxidase/L-pipecolate oxidase